MNSGVSTFSYVVGVAVSFALGYTYARAQRAFSDYTKTKALVPELRKTAWSMVWSTIKAGVLALVILAVFIGWITTEMRRH